MRRFPVLCLVLSIMAGVSSDSGAGRLPSIPDGAFQLQDESPSGRKPNQRCSVTPPAGCPRAGEANNPPDVKLEASEQKIVQPCGEGKTPRDCTPSESQRVRLQALASDGDGDTLRYAYSATGGRISGDGPNVTWELAGVQPGRYTATVEVDDMCGCVAFSSTMVTVAACDDCGANSP